MHVLRPLPAGMTADPAVISYQVSTYVSMCCQGYCRVCISCLAAWGSVEAPGVLGWPFVLERERGGGCVSE